MISYASIVFLFLFFSSCSSLAFPALWPREICYETDTLLSFRFWIDDALPYCSSLLSISDSTTFIGATESHTITVYTVTATSYDTIETVTVPQATALVTTTIANGGVVLKRQENASNLPMIVAPIPIAATANADGPVFSNFPSIAQTTPIVAAAYSACSCLSVVPSTVTARPSAQFTRTIDGIDFETLGVTTVTIETTTMTTTVFGSLLPAAHSVFNSTVSTPSSRYPTPGSLVPTKITKDPLSGHAFPTLNISTISIFSVSAGIFPSVNATANPTLPIPSRPIPNFNFTAYSTLPRSGFLPSPTVNMTANSSLPRSGLWPMPTTNSTANSTLPRSGLFPLPTVNLTTNFNASVSGHSPLPVLNTTASGRLPLPSRNATRRPLSPITGFLPIPTLNGTNRTLPTGVTFPLSDRLPIQTLNATRPSVRVPSPTLNSTSRLPVLPTGTAPPFSISGRPRLPLNISSLPHLPSIGNVTASALATSSIQVTNISTTTPSLPIGTEITPLGCPSINSTVYTTPTEPAEQYQLRCSVDYAGFAFADLDEPDLEGCIQKCSNINIGFSEGVCHGVSFLQYNTGLHCTLLAQSGLNQSTYNPLAVSAVLLTGGEAPIGRA